MTVVAHVTKHASGDNTHKSVTLSCVLISHRLPTTAPHTQALCKKIIIQKITTPCVGLVGRRVRYNTKSHLDNLKLFFCLLGKFLYTKRSFVAKKVKSKKKRNCT